MLEIILKDEECFGILLDIGMPVSHSAYKFLHCLFTGVVLQANSKIYISHFQRIQKMYTDLRVFMNRKPSVQLQGACIEWEDTIDTTKVVGTFKIAKKKSPLLPFIQEPNP